MKDLVNKLDSLKLNSWQKEEIIVEFYKLMMERDILKGDLLIEKERKANSICICKTNNG